MACKRSSWVDTSWDFSGTRRRLRNPCVWILFIVCFCVVAPSCGFAAFWAAFAEGMRAFGPSYKPTLLDGIIWLFTRLPVPHRQSLELMVINGVFWGAGASFLLALLLARRFCGTTDNSEPPADDSSPSGGAGREDLN